MCVRFAIESKKRHYLLLLCDKQSESSAQPSKIIETSVKSSTTNNTTTKNKNNTQIKSLNEKETESAFLSRSEIRLTFFARSLFLLPMLFVCVFFYIAVAVVFLESIDKTKNIQMTIDGPDAFGRLLFLHWTDAGLNEMTLKIYMRCKLGGIGVCTYVLMVRVAPIIWIWCERPRAAF